MTMLYVSVLYMLRCAGHADFNTISIFVNFLMLVMHPAFFALLTHSFSTSIPPLLQDPSFSQVTQQQRNKSKDNSSIDDTRNAVLLLQTDYKANRHYYRPSPRCRPGPRNRLLLRRAHIPLLPSTTRRTDEPTIAFRHLPLRNQPLLEGRDCHAYG